MSNKLIFEPSDFYATNTKVGMSRSTPSMVVQGAADSAQAKFNAWLESQQVVYSKPTTQWMEKQFLSPDEATHKARLVCIEALAPKVCAHYGWPTETGWECSHCGAKLKPTWSAE